MFRSITVDNGTEFSDFKGIERSVLTKSKRTQVYYCHPYSSYERGSNENQNKLIRRHYPKGTSFDGLKQSDIDKLQDWIITILGKCSGGVLQMMFLTLVSIVFSNFV